MEFAENMKQHYWGKGYVELSFAEYFKAYSKKHSAIKSAKLYMQIIKLVCLRIFWYLMNYTWEYYLPYGFGLLKVAKSSYTPKNVLKHGTSYKNMAFFSIDKRGLKSVYAYKFPNSSSGYFGAATPNWVAIRKNGSDKEKDFGV